MNVFNYNNCLLFLQDTLKSNLIEGGQKELAFILGCQPAYLSRILKGSASLSFEQTFSLCKHLKMKDQETNFFLSLLSMERAGTKELKDFSHKRVIELKEEAFKSREGLGAYQRSHHKHLEGHYKCIRPLFSNKDEFEVSFLHVFWDENENCFEFIEKKDRAHRGKLFIPSNIFFVNFVTIEKGFLRMITMTDIEVDGKDLCRAHFSTLSNPEGTTFIPASSQMLIHKNWTGETSLPTIHHREAQELQDYIKYFDLTRPLTL